MFSFIINCLIVHVFHYEWVQLRKNPTRLHPITLKLHYIFISLHPKSITVKNITNLIKRTHTTNLIKRSHTITTKLALQTTLSSII